MKPEELRAAAATESAWCESRMAVYKEDGAKIPEAIARLHCLSENVLEFLPGLGAMLDARDDAKRLRDVHALCCDVRIGLDKIMATLDMAPAPIVAAMTQTLAESTPAAPPFAAGGHVDKGQDAAGRHGVAVEASLSPSPAYAAAGEGAADGLGRAERIIATELANGPKGPECFGGEDFPGAPVVVRGGYHRLRHSLVLRDSAGAERLFSEPAKGQWSVQCVAPDRKSAFEPFSCLADAWPADVWTEAPAVDFAPALSKWDAPVAKTPAKTAPKYAQDRTVALPGMGDVAPKSTATVKEHMPSDDRFKAWTSALGKKVGRTVTEGEVRTSYVAWQTENCDKVLVNPEAAFWQHAVKVMTATLEVST